MDNKFIHAIYEAVEAQARLLRYISGEHDKSSDEYIDSGLMELESAVDRTMITLVKLMENHR